MPAHLGAPNGSPLSPALEALDGLLLGVEDGIVKDEDVKAAAEGAPEDRPNTAMDGGKGWRCRCGHCGGDGHGQGGWVSL